MITQLILQAICVEGALHASPQRGIRELVLNEWFIANADWHTPFLCLDGIVAQPFETEIELCWNCLDFCSPEGLKHEGTKQGSGVWRETAALSDILEAIKSIDDLFLRADWVAFTFCSPLISTRRPASTGTPILQSDTATRYQASSFPAHNPTNDFSSLLAHRLLPLVLATHKTRDMANVS